MISINIEKKTVVLLTAIMSFFAIADFVSVVDAESNGGVTVIQETTPVGAIAMWGTSTPPTGWIELNGQSTSGYPKLAAVYGSNVPDFRGQFVRGWDNGAGVDADSSRGLLTIQGDAIRNITGNFRSLTRSPNSGGAISYTTVNTTDYSSGNTHPYGRNYTFDASTQVPTADENRPKNITVMYIVKAE